MDSSGVFISFHIRSLSLATRAEKVYSSTRPGNKSLTIMILFNFQTFAQTHMILVSGKREVGYDISFSCGIPFSLLFPLP